MRILIVILSLLVSNELLALEEHYIKEGENIIHTITYGKGEPILIINGGPGMSSEGYHSLAEKLGEKNLAIIYNQRDTGQSKLEKVDASTITMKGMLDDIEKILTYLKVDKWVVLGQSFGGMLASHYSSHYMERTKELILSSSGGVDMGLISNFDITARLTQKDKDSLFY